jgi:hypothetical protein
LFEEAKHTKKPTPTSRVSLKSSTPLSQMHNFVQQLAWKNSK